MIKDKRASVYFDRTTLQFVGLSPGIMTMLRSAFKGVDIEEELNKMCIWLTGPKGCKRRPSLKFIMSWLGKAPRDFNRPNNSSTLPPILSSFVQDYMQDVWKKAKHVLEANTMST